MSGTCPMCGSVLQKQGLSPRQAELLGIIKSFIDVRGYSPSIKELSEIRETVPSNIHRLIAALVDRGYVTNRPGFARSLSVL
jgi:repressor LexA